MLFRVLSDETRRGILGMLRRGAQCLCDLQSTLMLHSPGCRIISKR